MRKVFLVKVQRAWEESERWHIVCAVETETEADTLIARMIRTEVNMVTVAGGATFKREQGDTFDVDEVPFSKVVV